MPDICRGTVYVDRADAPFSEKTSWPDFIPALPWYVCREIVVEETAEDIGFRDGELTPRILIGRNGEGGDASNTVALSIIIHDERHQIKFLERYFGEETNWSPVVAIISNLTSASPFDAMDSTEFHTSDSFGSSSF